MDPAPGVPVPSCPAAWLPPPEPFLWSRGVWAGVESRSFGLLYRKTGEEKPLKSEILGTAECFFFFYEEWAVKVNAALFQSERVCTVEFDKCNLGVSSKFTFPTESVGQKNAGAEWCYLCGNECCPFTS